MAKIVLTRIDSRLIHGQVMTKWVNQSKANRIIVVSDELANDEFMRSVYLMSAPEGIKIDCFTEKQTLDEFKNEEFGSGNVLLLLPSLQVMSNIVEAGVSINSIQVGGLGGAPNRKAVYKNITLDEPDAIIVETLLNKGIDVYFQIIPEDAPQKAEDILKKYRKGE